MLTLENLFVLMLVATAGAWLWHNHGLREKALERVKQHCAKLDLELLDDAVALKRIAFVRDANGRKRLARVYAFEFTVTGEQRHPGTATQFGAHSVQIELSQALYLNESHGEKHDGFSTLQSQLGQFAAALAAYAEQHSEEV